MENRDYCSVTAVWYMWKKDNGKEQTCTFMHNNVTQITLTKKAYFNFPPTMVKITGNKPSKTGAILTLTCSTDSSYPVSSLEWRKGTKTDINENDVINNNTAPVVMDAEYNGKNISQNLGLAVTRAMNGQRVSCCADDVCDSVILAIDTTSAGVTVTAWMTLLVACLIFISQLQN
ncbi:uncharacterized protein LOC123560150 [Mercenaria mercenaria]|uniref:uncharacterized protein LOC123560150 n=1 Tax=Mercenaria mercenaria TaxID=6596 RepID=UPI00234F14B6|nr:uncharacterized protein LOC123560150 [Mercenaria mercenaria]